MSIHADIEEDYESLYGDSGSRPDPFTNTCIPVGRCKGMCSLDEMYERERNRRLSKFEVVPGMYPPRVDKSKAVKEFTRSCVGNEFTLSDNLRPWSVLKRTIYYLLGLALEKSDDWMYVSDFVFDRLRAIRQDMIIQRIEGRRYIEALEGSCRFLIYSMYKLTCSLQDYTRKEPMQPLVPLEGSVKGLSNYEMNIVREMKLTMQCLRDCLKSLIRQYEDNVPNSPYRPLFEAVNLIVNLPFVIGYERMPTKFQAVSELRNSDLMFKTVYKMFREHLVGHHWTALKYLPDLIDFPIIILAYAPVIAQLQIHLVKLLRKLYASANNKSSVKHLCDIVCPEFLDDDEDQREVFGRFIATQFGFYDEKKDICDWKLDKSKNLNFLFDYKLEKLEQDGSSYAENETRNYALQMAIGREWHFYKEVIKLHGLESILDPTQPEDG